MFHNATLPCKEDMHVRFIKKYLKGKKKCDLSVKQKWIGENHPKAVSKPTFKKFKISEEGNMRCNMENVPKAHIIHSNQINILYVNNNYHTTTDHTKCHMKIHTKTNPYHCSMCAKKIHIQEPHEESC